MARRYKMFGLSSFLGRSWTRVVPKGTRGSKMGLIFNGKGKGFTEIWTRPRKRRVSGAAFHLKRTRGGRGRWL